MSLKLFPWRRPREAYSIAPHHPLGGEPSPPKMDGKFESVFEAAAVWKNRYDSGDFQAVAEGSFLAGAVWALSKADNEKIAAIVDIVEAAGLSSPRTGEEAGPASQADHGP